MVRMTVRQQFAGLAFMAMIAAVGCQQQEGKSGSAGNADQTAFREITLEVTGLT